MKPLSHGALALLLTFAAHQATGAEPHPIAAEVAGKLPNPAQPFVMLVQLRTAPGKAEGLIEAMTEPSLQTAKEPGNVAYELSRDPKDPASFVLYERWKNVAALDSHLKQPYLVKLLKDFDSVLAEPPEVTVLKPIAFEK